MLPGIHTFSPFEEGIPHTWLRGLVDHPLDLGGGGVEICEKWGAR